MADVLTLARRRYVERQLLRRRAVRAVRKAWAGIDPAQIRVSWAVAVGPAVYSIVSGAQAEAAAAADTTTAAMLAAQGLDPAATGALVAAAFSGVASDGRDLAALLELANRQALRAITAGFPVKAALQAGGRFLDSVTSTQVADAGRVADEVAVTARRAVSGSYRVLSPPSCSRCVVLAGRWYRWDAGFSRHPRCDCISAPADDGVLDGNPKLWSPNSYFDSLSPAVQDRVFTIAGAQALRDGAAMSQVVNARSGMYTASGKLLTNSGTAYRNGGIRLMPEQIYREANGDRDRAIQMLHLYGYLS